MQILFFNLEVPLWFQSLRGLKYVIMLCVTSVNMLNYEHVID